MIPCQSCGGSGEIFIYCQEDEYDLHGQCNECGGSGFLHESADPDIEREVIYYEE